MELQNRLSDLIGHLVLCVKFMVSVSSGEDTEAVLCGQVFVALVARLVRDVERPARPREPQRDEVAHTRVRRRQVRNPEAQNMVYFI